MLAMRFGSLCFATTSFNMWIKVDWPIQRIVVTFGLFPTTLLNENISETFDVNCFCTLVKYSL
jgi:hypothetical protein